MTVSPEQYRKHEKCISNINEHRSHTSKISEHGRSDILLVRNDLKLVQKARKAFVHAGFGGIFISMVSEHH